MTALTAAALFVVDRSDFKRILRQETARKMLEYLKLVNQTDLLSTLLAEEKKHLVECFVEVHYKKGDVVLQEGAKGNTFYILYEGPVDVTARKNPDPVSLSADKKQGGKCVHFGEQALMDENAARTATVTVTSESAAVLALAKTTFESVLGPLVVGWCDMGTDAGFSVLPHHL